MKLRILPLLLAVLAFTLTGCSSSAGANENNEENAVNASDIIIGHVTDSHSWHILDYKTVEDGKIEEHVVGINLPIILVDDGRLELFYSKRFHHGKAVYQGKSHTYALVGGGLAKEEIICVEPAVGDADAVVCTDHEGNAYKALVDADGNTVKPIDISITKTAAAIMISVTLLIIIIMSVARQYRKRGTAAPHGLQSLIEMLVLHVRDEIVGPILGHHTDKFLPYLLTLFFFIFFCNILGLIPIFPAGANITGNIAVTAILALITFLITNLSGNRHYWKDIFNTPGVPAWLKVFPLMPVVELVGVFTKPIVLMIRLFANMTAGHIIVLGFVTIIFIMTNVMGLYVGGAVSVVSVLFSVFIDLLECLVAYIQAFVFTMLSALYISMAVETPEEA